MILHDIIVPLKGPLVLHYHRAFSSVNVVRTYHLLSGADHHNFLSNQIIKQGITKALSSRTSKTIKIGNFAKLSDSITMR